MPDYQCWTCHDSGDCNNCSWFFEPDTIHKVCGWAWSEHKSVNYTSHHECPERYKPEHSKFTVMKEPEAQEGQGRHAKGTSV